MALRSCHARCPTTARSICADHAVPIAKSTHTRSAAKRRRRWMRDHTTLVISLLPCCSTVLQTNKAIARESSKHLHERNAVVSRRRIQCSLAVLNAHIWSASSRATR
eukprot:scaffold33211_cov33-Tisochrysis_lutea.AAC.4